MTVKTTYLVEGMCCPAEAKLVRSKLADFAGIASLEIDVVRREVVVTHEPAAKRDIGAALESLEMGVRETPDPEATSNAKADAPPTPSRPWYLEHAPLVVAGCAATAAEAVGWLGGTERSISVGVLTAVALLAAGRRPLAKAWVAIKTGSLTIDVLMTIAVTGALVIGQWGEAAMVAFLFGVAEAIEGASLDRARHAIGRLMELAPPTATLRKAERWVEASVESVRVDDVVRVRAGDRVPLDGTVVDGCSAVDQAPVTGESVPVDKTVGDPVFAGTINQEGSLDVRITAASADSTLARIARAVKEAQASKPAIERFVDRFSRIYTPAVVVVAIFVAVGGATLLHGGWSVWVYRALVLLVIACPCALVIATPVTVVSALTGAARRGILIKGGAHLETAARITIVAVDKTGTITSGMPVVTDVVPLAELGRDQALQLAASLNARSKHPIARAIATAHAGDVLEVADFSSLAGRGVAGRIEGEDIFVGNALLAGERGARTPELDRAIELLQQDGKTVSVLGRGNRALAIVAVADAIKPSSRDAVSILESMGVKVVMLTGDNARTAAKVAAEAGVTTVRADLLPDDKLRAIDELAAEGVVAMVGDGINDAPALAKAQLGVAMGKAGSDVAIETADVALMQDDLLRVPELLRLGRRAVRVLKGNMAFAIMTKLVFLSLAIAGVATLWMAVFADVGTSLLVVLSGLRLLRPPPVERGESRSGRLAGSVTSGGET